MWRTELWLVVCWSGTRCRHCMKNDSQTTKQFFTTFTGDEVPCTAVFIVAAWRFELNAQESAQMIHPIRDWKALLSNVPSSATAINQPYPVAPLNHAMCPGPATALRHTPVRCPLPVHTFRVRLARIPGRHRQARITRAG